MAYQSGQNMIVGLDIGTSKVVALIAEVLPGDELQVVGMGTSPTRGWKRAGGGIMEPPVQPIQQPVTKPNKLPNSKCNPAMAGLPGGHIGTRTSVARSAIPK